MIRETGVGRGYVQNLTFRLNLCEGEQPKELTLNIFDDPSLQNVYYDLPRKTSKVVDCVL
jgi:hypothetical protein